MEDDPREQRRRQRLRAEFERVKKLWTPHCLFEIWCSPLDAHVGEEVLRSNISMKVLRDGLSGFMSLDDFDEEYPYDVPEVYLVAYTCKGLMRDQSEQIHETESHWMEVIYGWDYPATPPKFVWHTPIWHPNFRAPSICLEGRPFAVGRTLDSIIVEVGRLVQFQAFNLNDHLDKDATEWTRRNPNLLPIDRRDLRDRRRELTFGTPAQLPSPDDEVLVTLAEEESEVEAIGTPTRREH